MGFLSDVVRDGRGDREPGRTRAVPHVASLASGAQAPGEQSVEDAAPPGLDGVIVGRQDVTDTTSSRETPAARSDADSDMDAVVVAGLFTTGLTSDSCCCLGAGFCRPKPANSSLIL